MALASQTLLQLATTLYTEAGAAGTAPSSVAGATGEWARLVNWIIQSDMDIQNLYVNWKFLRGTVTFDTEANQNPNTYSLSTLNAANLAEWDFDAFQCYYNGSGVVPSPIRGVEYEMVKWEPIDPLNIGAPDRIVVMPDNSLRIDPISDQAYQLYGEYYNNPTQMLQSDTAQPIMPARFQRIIVGRALVYYGNYENAPEIIQQGTQIYTDYLARLENSQLPNKENARFRMNARFEVGGGYGDDGSSYHRDRNW
jgi:hypothetical protein